MENTVLSPETTTRIVWLLSVVAVEYVLVLAASIGDLISGIRKSRRLGKPARSHEMRRTVDKLARYYNVLAILTVIDAMQITGSFYLRIVEGYSFPTIPIFTLIGSLGMAFIEVKSIFEDGDEKEKEKLSELAGILEVIATDNKTKELINLLKSLKK